MPSLQKIFTFCSGIKLCHSNFQSWWVVLMGKISKFAISGSSKSDFNVLWRAWASTRVPFWRCSQDMPPVLAGGAAVGPTAGRESRAATGVCPGRLLQVEWAPHSGRCAHPASFTLLELPRTPLVTPHSHPRPLPLASSKNSLQVFRS